MDSSMEIPCTQVLDDFLPDDSPQSSPEKKKQVGTLRIQGSGYPIFTGENRIGRDPKICSIVLDAKALSAEHAIIEAHTIDSVFISDLESTNKTRLGKMILKPQIRYQLQDKAQVYFADILATYHQLAKYDSSVESMDSSKEGDLFIPETPSDNTFKKPGDRLCIVESPSDDSIIESSQPVREDRSEPSNGVRKHIIFGEVKDESTLESICEAATQLEFDEVKPDICEAPTQCFEADVAGKLKEEPRKSETADICEAPTQCFDILESDHVGKAKKEGIGVCDAPTQCLNAVVAGGVKSSTREEKSDSDTDPEEVFGGHDEKKSDSDADTSMTDIFNAPTQLVEGEYGDESKKEEQPSPENVKKSNEQLDISSTENNVKVSDSPKKFDEVDDLFDAPTQKINHNHTKDSDVLEKDGGKDKTVDPEPMESEDLLQAPTQIISNETLQFNFVKPESRKRKEAEKVTESTLNADHNQNGELPVAAELERSVAHSGKNNENSEDDLFDAPTQLINEDYLLGEDQISPSKKTDVNDETSSSPDQKPVEPTKEEMRGDAPTRKQISPDTKTSDDQTVADVWKEMKAPAEPDLFDAPTQVIDNKQISPDTKTSDDQTVADVWKEMKAPAEPDLFDAPTQVIDNKQISPDTKTSDDQTVADVWKEMKAPAEPDLFDAPTQVIDNKQISPSEKSDLVSSVVQKTDGKSLRDDATFSKVDDKTMTEFSVSDKNAPNREEKVKFAKPVDSVNEEKKVEPDDDNDLFDAPTQVLHSEPQHNFVAPKSETAQNISTSVNVDNEGGDNDILDIPTQILPSERATSKAKDDISLPSEQATSKAKGDSSLPSEQAISKAKDDSSSEKTSTSVTVDNEDGDNDILDVQTQILPSEQATSKAKDDSSSEKTSTSVTVDNEDGDNDILDVQTQILPSEQATSKAKDDSSSEKTSTSVTVDNEDGDNDILDVQTQILPSEQAISKAKDDSSSEKTSTSVTVDNEDGDNDILDVQTQILPSEQATSKAKDDSSSEKTSTSVTVDNEDGDNDILDVPMQILPSEQATSKVKDDSSLLSERAICKVKGDSSSEKTSTSVNVDNEDGDNDILNVQTQILPSEQAISKAKGDTSLPSDQATSKAKGDSSSGKASTSVNVENEDGDNDISDVQTQILPSEQAISKAKDDISLPSEQAISKANSVNVENEDGDNDISDVQTQILPSEQAISKAKDDISLPSEQAISKAKDDSSLPSEQAISKAKDDSSVEKASTSVNVDNGDGDNDILDAQTQILPSEWGHSKATGNGSSEKDEEQTTKSVEGEVNNSNDIESSELSPSKAKENDEETTKSVGGEVNNSGGIKSSEPRPSKAKESDEASSLVMKTTESVRGEVCEASSRISDMLPVTSKVASGIPSETGTSVVIDGKDDGDKGSEREAEKLNENADVGTPSRMKGDLDENLHSTDICIDIFDEQKEVPPPPLKKSRARVYTNRAKQRTEDEEEHSKEEPESGDDTADTRTEEVTSSPVLKQNHVRKRSATVPSSPEKESDLQDGIASPVIQKQSHLKRKGLATYSNRNKRLKVESDSPSPEVSSLLGSERSESRIPVLSHPGPEGRRKRKEPEASPRSMPRKTSRSKNVKEQSKGSVTNRERSQEKLVKDGEQKPVAGKRRVSLRKDENKPKEDAAQIPDSRRSSRRNEVRMDEPKVKEEPVARKKMPLDTVKQKDSDLSPSKSRLKSESKQSSGQASRMKGSEADSDMSPRKSRSKVESKTSSPQASSRKDSASDSDVSPRKSRSKVESKMSSTRASSTKDITSDSDVSSRKSRSKVESKTSSTRASSTKDSASESDMSPRKSRSKVESKTSSPRASSRKDSASGSDVSPRKSRSKVESKASSTRASSTKDSTKDSAQRSSTRASSTKDSTRDSAQRSSTRASSTRDSGQQLPRTTRKRASAPPAKQEPENKYEDSSDSAARRTSNRRAKHVEEVNTDFVYTSSSRNSSPNLSKKQKRDDTESESSQSESVKVSRSQSKTSPQKEASVSSRSNKRKLSDSEVVASPKRVRGSSRLNESVTSGVEGSPTRGRGRASTAYKVLFTGVSCTKEDEEFVRKLGGSVVDTPDSCTVLVTDKVRRTYKFLCIMGMGKPVVSLEWLKKSRQSGSFLDPWQYIVKDVESEMKFSFSLHDSLKVASQHQLLTGYSVMVTSSVKPPPQEMKGIITSSGGKVLTRNPGNSWPEKSFTISCPDDKSQWSKVKKGGRPIVGAEVLLLGVLQQKLDLKTHALQ